MRSEDWIPADIRRVLTHPRLSQFAVCGCLILVVVACFYGIRTAADRRLEALLGGRALKSYELIESERAFAAAGLSAYKIDSGQILVPAGVKSQYMNALVDQDVLPKQPGGLELAAVEKSSFLESAEQRRIRLRLANERAMSRILSEFDGIDEAVVHFDEANVGRFQTERETTAMVAIRTCPGAVVDDAARTSIRNAVAAYKAGLDPDDVTIVRLKTAELPAQNDVKQAVRSNGPVAAWLRNHQNQIVQATAVLLAIVLVAGVLRDMLYRGEPEDDVEHTERTDQDLRVYAPIENENQSMVNADPQEPETTAEPRDSFVHADLTELVREHPEAASEMLKSWVKAAS